MDAGGNLKNTAKIDNIILNKVLTIELDRN